MDLFLINLYAFQMYKEKEKTFNFIWERKIMSFHNGVQADGINNFLSLELISVRRYLYFKQSKD